MSAPAPVEVFCPTINRLVVVLLLKTNGAPANVDEPITTSVVGVALRTKSPAELNDQFVSDPPPDAQFVPSERQTVWPDTKIAVVDTVPAATMPCEWMPPIPALIDPRTNKLFPISASPIEENVPT